MPYNFLDAEFGGLEKEKYSLLTVYFIATDNNFNIVDELSLSVKPNDGIYHVCASAMDVNKINLVEHDRIAIPYKEAGTILYKWLDKITGSGKEKLICVGHGVKIDIEFVIQYLINIGTWEKFNSYRVLDTSSTCQFLKSCNLFPDTVSGSLTSLAKYLSIEVNENETHTAKYDTLLTYKIFLALRKILLPVIPAINSGDPAGFFAAH